MNIIKKLQFGWCFNATLNLPTWLLVYMLCEAILQSFHAAKDNFTEYDNESNLI